MTNVYLMTGAQCRMARSLLKWSREMLAKEANVSRGTICTFEDDTPIRESIILDIQSVFDAHGVECNFDGSVRPRSDGIKDFRGLGGCDRFFENIEKMLEENDTGVICRIGAQGILTNITGRNGLTNFDRLQSLSKQTQVRCLLSDQKIYLPGTPSFEVRVYPESRPSIIASEFAYGDEATFAVEQDSHCNFRHTAYMVIEYSNLAKRMFASFEKHWIEAKPYMMAASKRTASAFDCQTSRFDDYVEPRRQACY
ncbi:MAG: hypothetical protein PHS57_01095 [Alphaproteobacteria bacterium]|nr:hypothetical protein [Alphaproteobacteria bacterium]